MTSATFQTVNINDISVNRSERQRKVLKDINILADSIRKTGLINPPVVTQDFVLVAGERRLTACRDVLGWTHIPVQLTDDLPKDELHLIELEENVKRLDLDWKDEVLAVEEYHRLRMETEEDWNATQTATALGYASPSTVTRKLDVAEVLLDGQNSLVNSADKFSVASGLVERAKARKQADLSTLLSGQVQAPQPLPVEEPTGPEEAKTTTPKIPSVPLDTLVASPAVPLETIEFQDWLDANKHLGPQFNFVHCDFPYGVNADRHKQGASDKFGGYEDSADVYYDLLGTLAEAMDTIIAPSAHLIFWFSMDYYQFTLEALTNMGWTVNPFPLIWHKSDNSGTLPDPKRGPRRIYETAFMASRGDRLVVQPVANVSAYPNVKAVHMSEKNVNVLAHFFRMIVDENTRMIDPTCGSANAPIIAEHLGAASVLGLERDPEFADRARKNWVDFRKMQEKAKQRGD